MNTPSEHTASRVPVWPGGAQEHQRAQLLPWPHSALEAIGRRLFTSSKFHCLSYALHQMMVKARVPRWPCHLSLLTKACVNSLMYGIYQMDQNNKSYKLQGRYPFFFFIVHIPRFALLFSSIFCYTENVLSLKSSMAEHVDYQLWFIISYELPPAASGSIKKLPELMEDCSFSS